MDLREPYTTKKWNWRLKVSKKELTYFLGYVLKARPTYERKGKEENICPSVTKGP